jgi:hypothetical protein
MLCGDERKLKRVGIETETRAVMELIPARVVNRRKIEDVLRKNPKALEEAIQWATDKGYIVPATEDVRRWKE